MRIKSYINSNSWLIWVFLLFIMISYFHGIEIGLIIIALIISGVSLGIIIPVIITVIFGKIKVKNLFSEFIMFISSTLLLYFNISDKKLLFLIIPFAIPVIITISITLINNKD